ncbi:hypothetical protein [Leptothrix discophora]|uniref:Uncharacterized protein n=1 Tax=Leptothrix discophora TaxID=89 RepID=A0ABT9G0Q7_LEPDI|nr:hypothetical protein [Leptothrix discophora]MDP4300000.1 hypothetical protein [Leptothrix discophora]
MKFDFQRHPIACAAVAALGVLALGGVADGATAGKPSGTYVAGDFHNHTTCSDGSISMQKLVKKSTDKNETPWGLDWFVQAGHGGSGNRNCTLAEDASLATPAYPLVFDAAGTLQGPSTTWQNTNPPVEVKGAVSGTAPSRNMWRWQSIQEFQYPLLEYLAAYQNKPMFMGMESVVAGHEHASMSVITGQIPNRPEASRLPTGPGYVALGNANALAQWSYCFDRNVTDTSRGNTTTTSGVGNNWDCSVTGSANAADPSWNDLAKKLVPAGGAGAGERGHLKTVEALKWMAEHHPNGSYYVPAHLERAGPFNPNGNNGFNIEHLRNFNNVAPKIAFGFETQPGHGASSERGEYFPARNNIGGVLVDSVGGTTYGGTGVYGAQVGGVWDALLGEGRNWWFFASSDWHNRGSFGPDDRRSTQDFYPGEYQRNYTLVQRKDDDHEREGAAARTMPQRIVDGLRTGNTFVSAGQLIDRLAFVACVAEGGRKASEVEEMAVKAARRNATVDEDGCATMGEKLVVPRGASVIVAVALRDPSGANYSPYTFANPSLAQVGIQQPLNKPVLDHVDVIGGLVTGYKTAGSADYAGEWPRTWLANPDMGTVPAGAKNTSAKMLRTFNAQSWSTFRDDAQFKKMSFRLSAVEASQFVRLRGSNLPANVPFETDASGNPLPDLHTNATTTTATSVGSLKIPCTVVGSNVPSNSVNYTGNTIDGCPAHLPLINGVKYVAYDVAAWSDLWFYSNPIYLEVRGSTKVAGLR